MLIKCWYNVDNLLITCQWNVERAYIFIKSLRLFTRSPLSFATLQCTSGTTPSHPHNLSSESATCGWELLPSFICCCLLCLLLFWFVLCVFVFRVLHRNQLSQHTPRSQLAYSEGLAQHVSLFTLTFHIGTSPATIKHRCFCLHLRIYFNVISDRYRFIHVVLVLSLQTKWVCFIWDWT